MAQVGEAFVRIRPVLASDERQALEELAALSRSLADGLDRFLTMLPTPPEIEEKTHD